MNNRKTLDAVIVIRLPLWAREKLDKIARRKGIGASTLVRMWVMEKFKQPAKSS